jgi:methyl-accepting chemotaxis protein
MQIFGGFNKSIGTKILACILLTLIVILGVRLWIINKYQTEILKTEAKNTSRLFSNGIAHLVQKAIQPNNNTPVDKEMLELFVKDLSSPAEIESLFVVDSQGTVLFSKDRNKIGSVYSVPGLDRAISKGEIVEALQPVIKGDSRIDAYLRIVPIFDNVSGRNVIGAVCLSLNWFRTENAISDVLNRNILSLVVSLLIISVLIFFFLQRTLINPVKKLIEGAENLASKAGDLTQKIGVGGDDEVGALAVAFNRIITFMHSMVSRVRSTADNVSLSAEELSSSAQEINASTQEISNAIQQISRGITTQAKRVEDTHKIIDEMSSSLKQVASNAQSSAQGVSQITKKAEAGRIVIEEAVEKINRLTSTVNNATSVIQGLGEKSQQIGEITDTITVIADQTNLLALNAAIEAARAGEAGRGFAVVAEEVRKLAEESTDAVRKIGALIKTIQSETGRAVTSIESSSREVVEGKEFIMKVASILTEINRAVQQALLMSNEISTATQQQLIAAEEVGKGIEEIASVSRDATITSEDVSSNTQEQTASMQEMATSALELARMAVELKELVGKFKLKEDERK